MSKMRLILLPFMLAGALTGCAGVGESTEAPKAIPDGSQFVDISSKLGKDGTVGESAPAPSTAPAPGPVAGSGQTPATGPTAPTTQQILQNQPLGKVDPEIVRVLQASIDASQVEEYCDVAKCCNLGWHAMATRQDEQNPFVVAVVNEAKNEGYFPELMAFNALSSIEDWEPKDIGVMYRDGDGRKIYYLPLWKKVLKTVVKDSIKTKDGTVIHGAGVWYIALIPPRLHKELRSGHVSFFFRPKNLFVTDDTFTNHANAVGAVGAGSDLVWESEARKDGTFAFRLKHVPGNEFGDQKPFKLKVAP